MAKAKQTIKKTTTKRKTTKVSSKPRKTKKS